MAIAVRAVGTTALMLGGSITLTVPTVSNGDLMIANVYSTDVGAASPQTGWNTLIITQARAGEDWAFYWRIAASEPASYTWSWGVGSGVGNITAFSGVDTSTPIDVAALAGTAATSGTTLTAPTRTTVTNNAWLVCSYAVREVANFSQPTGMTEQYDISGTFEAMSLDTQLIAAAGATGTRDSTVSTTINFGRAVSFGIRPFVATAPGAPTLGTITPGNAQLSAAFTPGTDGGSSITTYKYSTDNGATYLTRQTGTTASPIVISTLSSDGTTPLSNGTSYTVLIKAVNAVGDGTASNAVAATPSTTPGAPTLGTITPSNAQLSAAFTPGSTGGLSITTYKYSTDNGVSYLTRQTGTTASPIVITTLSSDGTTPLVNGTPYTVLIKAVNANGDGAASNAVTATPATTPSAPTALVATGGNAQVSVAFTAGATGGSAITSYKYSTDNGSTFRTRQTGTTASPVVITTLSSDGTTPLVNGNTYQIELKAVNAIGDGTASAAVSGTPTGNPTTDLKAALSMGVGGL